MKSQKTKFFNQREIMNQINIGIIGLGTVGKGVLEIIDAEQKKLFTETGIQLNLKKICDKDNSRIPNKFHSIFTSNWKDITESKEIDMIVELIGGNTIAYEVHKSALQNSKFLVTANKALLSEKGNELFSLAKSNQVEIGFEASVGGAIPVIRSIKTSLVSNNFLSIYGILNGTTNFILTKMEEEDMDYSDALKLAQELGFAEQDPTFDVEGIDAAHKLTLLAGLSFKQEVSISDISIEGISKISKSEIKQAKSLGLRIKLLGIAKKTEHGLELRVSPTMIPLEHPLASVKFEMNTIYFETSYSGPSMLMGKGAGSLPTASAVLSDIVYYAERKINKNSALENNLYEKGNIVSGKDTEARFYIRLKTIDKTGVLGQVTSILGKNSVSISSFRQNESKTEIVELIILTHKSKVGGVISAIEEIDAKKDIIKEKSIFLRLENFK
jgi:homoserine dehydrogenase